jgi:alpha-ribazole phosphatase
MEIYLIRHTTPDVKQGTCYGQSDIDVTATFNDEAARIRRHIPTTRLQVVCSPLRRCRKLAAYLFPTEEIHFTDKLKEIHCGDWELKRWDDIPEELSGPWMSDFVHTPFPQGENYVQLYERAVSAFTGITRNGLDTAVVTHAGVIRSILAHITGTPLEQSFNQFSLDYGCVFRLSPKGSSFEYQRMPNNDSGIE